MIVREFNIKEDYVDVHKWFKANNWQPMAPEMYGIQGYIAVDGDTKIAASWVYRDKKCPISIMEWTVGNPDISWEKRQKGINAVIDKCLNWAKEDGAQYIFTMTKNKRFLEKLKENKFMESDSGMTHLIRRL